MRPRSQGPSDGEGARSELDAGWNEVLDPARPQPAPAAPVEVAPAPAADVEPGADAGPRVAESSSVDLPTQTLEQETSEPDEPVVRDRSARDMDAMMSGSWAMATREGSSTAEPPAASASSSTMRGLRETDAEMAAIMGTRTKAAAGPTSTATPASSPTSTTVASTTSTTVASTTPASATPPAATPRRVVHRGSTLPATAGTIEPDDEPDRELPLPPRALRPQTGPAGVVRPIAARRMPSHEPRRITARTAALELGAPPKRLSLGWAVVAGIGIAGIAWVVGGPIRRPDATPSPTPTTDAAPSPAAPGADAKLAANEPALPRTPALDPSGPTALSRSDAGAEGGSEPPIETSEPEIVAPKPTVPVAPPTPPVAPAGRDARTPPPGTPADIAATFARLPVSPADLPPVGGIGVTGIHIDRVDMGASYDNKTGCVGVASTFSVAANEEINVCLRVVHPREEEVMSIVWQKSDGSTARRGKIAVKPIHAYRTRAYLRLRAEYIGAWTVRIVSADGVELASHAFKITA